MEPIKIVKGKSYIKNLYIDLVKQLAEEVAKDNTEVSGVLLDEVKKLEEDTSYTMEYSVAEYFSDKDIEAQVDLYMSIKHGKIQAIIEEFNINGRPSIDH